jgi:RHS repeat-associated protein
LSHYEYDANSNRILTVEGSATTTAAYDAEDRVVSWGDSTYTFNANGDLTKKTQNGSAISLTYDTLGNLVSLVDANGIETDYIVDAQNRRMGKKVAGVLVQGFIWQDLLKIAAELDGAGNIVSRFVYLSHANAPDYMVKGGVYYQIITEHLGSVRLVVDSGTGNIVQRIDYDAWGKVILDTNPGFQPFGFAGGLYDSRTGLTRFGYRDYDASIGRWTARDPIFFDGGDTNLYGYVVADPLNAIDLYGLSSCTYNIASHCLDCDSDDGTQHFHSCQPWSGNGQCRNNPACAAQAHHGPIPPGNWNTGCIGCTPSHPTPRIPITPQPGTDTQGRTDLQLHPGGNSEGCIVMPPRLYRQFLDFYRHDNQGELTVD